MVLAALGSLFLLAGDSAVQIDPTALRSRPTLGYLFLVLAVVLVAVTPLIRPLTLALRWIRMGDYRFAAAALGVVAIMIIAALLK